MQHTSDQGNFIIVGMFQNISPFWYHNFDGNFPVIGYDSMYKFSWKSSNQEEQITGPQRTSAGLVLTEISFWWIHYYSSNKSTGKETGKMHLCVKCAN